MGYIAVVDRLGSEAELTLRCCKGEGTAKSGAFLFAGTGGATNNIERLGNKARSQRCGGGLDIGLLPPANPQQRGYDMPWTTMLVGSGEAPGRTIIVGALQRERVTNDEVRSAARAQGLDSLDDVEAAVLETDGSISIVFRKGSGQLSTLSEIGSPRIDVVNGVE